MNPTPTIPGPETTAAAPSRVRLTAIVLARSIVFSALLGLLLFLPAGTWRFWQAWAFGAFYIVPIFLFLLLLVIVDPRAARRRLQEGEPTPTQRKIVRYLAPCFILALMAPGFVFRYGWTRRYLAPVPAWLCLAADFLALAGLLFALWTVWVNRYAARTIRVEEAQPVISSGPYRFVRHPMYFGLILSQVAMPVGMASLVTIPLFLFLIVFYVMRLLDEEKVLVRDLPGYTEYCRRTRWRLAPFLW